MNSDKKARIIELIKKDMRISGGYILCFIQEKNRKALVLQNERFETIEIIIFPSTTETLDIKLQALHNYLVNKHKWERRKFIKSQGETNE